MSTTLSLFWPLSSASSAQRLEASVKLVHTLQQFQSQHSSTAYENGGSDNDGDGSRDPLDLLNAPDVSYSIRRLVRGLASPRESSRIGFAVTLTELLSRLSTITCNQVVTLIKESTKSQGSTTGQEERDLLFARLFGYTSIIQSGLLVDTKSLASSASLESEISSILPYKDVIEQLMNLGRAKSWLRQSVWWSIGLSIDRLHGSDVIWKEDAFQWTISTIMSEDWSPEKVAMVIKLQSYYPDYSWKDNLAPTFKSSDILSTKNLPILAQILRESTVENSSGDQLASNLGSWRPQTHYVWDILLDIMFAERQPEDVTKGSVLDFFRIVVDESLFASNASQERKFWGFQVVQMALPRVSEDTLPMLFTKNFMRSWINHLSKNDRYLHKVAIQTAGVLQKVVQENPQFGFAVILQVTGNHGSQQFDKLTNTKTVESILTSMDVSGINNYVQYLMKQVDQFDDTERTDVNVVDARRGWIIEQFGSLIRSTAIPRQDDWIQSILDWFLVHGLYNVKKKSSKSSIRALQAVSSPPFSPRLQAQCRERLLASLGDLHTRTVTVKEGELMTQRALSIASDGNFWVSKVLERIHDFEGDIKHLELICEVDKELQIIYNGVCETLPYLAKVSDIQRNPAQGALLLLTSILLQLRCTEEAGNDLSESLASCSNAAEQLFMRKSSPNPDTDEDPLPIDTIVDSIIGILEKSSAYLRVIAIQSFGLLSQCTQASTIDLILAQFREEQSQDEGQSELNSDSEDDDDEEDDTSDDSNSLSEEVETEQDEEVDPLIRENIAKVLSSDVRASISDSDSSDEELMDDEQMLAIDEKLAEVFKTRVGAKKSTDAQREATHFKNRILDLVDMYLRKQANNYLCLQFLVPLIKLIISCSPDEKHLLDKASGIVRSRIGKAREAPSEGETPDATAILSDLHELACRASSSSVLGCISCCSLYVSKVMSRESMQASVVVVYKSSLEDYMMRRNSSLNTAFFLDLIRRFPQVGWNLRQTVLGFSTCAINGYRKGQAFRILQFIMMHSESIIIDPTPMTDFLKDLQKSLLQTIETSIVGDDVTASQLKDTLKVGIQVARQHRDFQWDIDRWNKLADSLAQSNRFKQSTGLQNMCRQMSRLTTSESLHKPKGGTKRSAESNPILVPKKVKRKKLEAQST